MNRLATFAVVVLICALIHPAAFTAETPAPTKTIYQAVMTGDAEQIRLHIARGTELNTPDAGQSTPLGIAIEMGRPEIIAMLLEAGVNVTTPSRNVPPIVSAAMRGQTDTVKLLVAKGAKVDTTDQYGMTPLLQAVENDRYEVAEYLIGAGADVNARDRRGQTPMSLARTLRLNEMANLLSQHGAQEPVNVFDTGPYGNRGLQAPTGPAASAQLPAQGGYGMQGTASQLLGDPNEIRTRLATFPGLPQALAGLDANSASEQRNWRQRRMDNRTMLIRSVEKQFDDEMTFVKGIAQAEKAVNTVAAVDKLVTERKARYAAISDELREERRAAILEERAATARTRSTGRSRGRGTDAMTANATDDLYGGAPAMPTPRTRPARDVNEPVLDPETEAQLQAWLSTDPLDKRGLLSAVHELDLTEYDALRQTAVAEQATKTAAAVEGLMLARQERLTAINAKMLEEEERLQRLEERRAGTTMTPGATRGRGGRGATTPGETPTTPRRGRRY